MLGQMKNALLIISHGSRRAASNEEVFALTSRIRELAAGRMVECAFLEITTPTVQQKIDEMAAAGVTHIQIFPHFLAAGTHVTNDIPREMEEAKLRHQTIRFNLLPHLGSMKDLPGLILGQFENDQ